MRSEFFSLANANKTQRSSATLGKLHRQIAPLHYLCYGNTAQISWCGGE